MGLLDFAIFKFQVWHLADGWQDRREMVLMPPCVPIRAELGLAYCCSIFGLELTRNDHCVGEGLKKKEKISDIF